MTEFQETDMNGNKTTIISVGTDPSVQASVASAVFVVFAGGLFLGFYFSPMETFAFLVGCVIYLVIRYLFLIYYKRRNEKNDLVIKQLNEKLRDPIYWRDKI